MKQDIISYMFNVEDTRTKSMFIMHFGRQQLNREINYISVCLWNIIYYYEIWPCITPIMIFFFNILSQQQHINKQIIYSV